MHGGLSKLAFHGLARRERQAEILADDRVVAAQRAGRGGRVRSPQETAAAASVTIVGDGRADASPSTNGAGPSNGAGSNGNGSAPVPAVSLSLGSRLVLDSCVQALSKGCHCLHACGLHLPPVGIRDLPARLQEEVWGQAGEVGLLDSEACQGLCCSRRRKAALLPT